MPPPNNALQGREMIEADLLVSGASIVTMNAARHIIADGALAVRGDRIVAVGKADALTRQVRAKRTIDGRRFVITPGLIDAHIHITGDPMTRGLLKGDPGETGVERLMRWIIPLFRGHSPQDESIAAQCSALAMMRSGVTCFIEAGTVSHLDAVMDGLAGTGIRGRLGEWVEGRSFDPSADSVAGTAAAIAVLESEIERYPDKDGSLLAAWPILVGHMTNTDEVWRAAKTLADEHGLGVTAHMSPFTDDADWYLAHYNRRPLEHLADIGVLGPRVSITHLAHIDRGELDLFIQSGANAVHCAQAAYLGGYGLSQHGFFPEMLEAGVNVVLGTDGSASNILSSGRLMAGLFRDAREDDELIGPGTILEMQTLNGSKALGLSHALGSLEVGKKADFVLHDTHRPEWGGAVLDIPTQLAFCAPTDAVHSVFINGVCVVDDGRATLIDEDKVIADARQASGDLIARTGLPVRTTWPVI